MEPAELMQVALTKFQTRVDSGDWQNLSQEQEKIVALEARLKKHEQTNNKKTQNKKTEKKSKRSNDQKKSNYNNNKNIKPDWMLVPPTKEEKKRKKKVVNNKTYFWCDRHKAWGRHTPTDCKGLGFKSEPKPDENVKVPTLKQQSTQLREEENEDSVSSQDE